MDHLSPDDLARLRAALTTLPEPVRRAPLARLTDGTYGLCLSCGEELGADLLTDAPARAWCPQCEADVVQRRSAARHGVCGQRGEGG